MSSRVQKDFLRYVTTVMSPTWPHMHTHVHFVSSSTREGVAGAGVGGDCVGGAGVRGDDVCGAGVVGADVGGDGVIGTVVGGAGVAGDCVGGEGVTGDGVSGAGSRILKDFLTNVHNCPVPGASHAHTFALGIFFDHFSGVANVVGIVHEATTTALHIF